MVLIMTIIEKHSWEFSLEYNNGKDDVLEDSDDDRADVLINPSLDTDLSSSKSEETSPDLTIIEQVKMIEDDGTMFILID